MAEKRFFFDLDRAPGDECMLTALIRDIKLTYGDRYEVNVRRKFPAIWRHNPYLSNFSQHDKGVVHLGRKQLEIDLKWTEKSFRHYVGQLHHQFQLRTGIHVPLLYPRPDFHFSDEEKANPYIEGKYWIIVPGGKQDFTVKWWSQIRYQEVVDRLRPWGLHFVQEGAVKKLCVHPPLHGALSMVGKTSIRDLMRNIYHAQGVICGITFPMHVAAGAERPCVVIAGGRECPWWEWYTSEFANSQFGDKLREDIRVPHKFLHTVRQLPCCEKAGCLQDRVMKLNDGLPNDRRLCRDVVSGPGGQLLPKCMDMITTSHVVEAVMWYYEHGYLERTPRMAFEGIGQPSGKYDPQTNRPPEGVVAEPTIRLSGGTEVGDLWTPEPRQVRQTEQEQTDQAAPHKQASHTIPGLQQPTETAASTTAHPNAAGLSLLDHPRIGGKVTIVVCCHGAFPQLARRCLFGILQTVPPSRIDLRIIDNQCCEETRQFLATLPATKIYRDDGQRRKYPAMREVFYDPEHRLQNYVIWFDDDSYVTDKNWLIALAQRILSREPAARVGMYGVINRHPLRIRREPDPRKWFRQSESWRGRDFQNTRGQESPNGDQVFFCLGGWWCLRREAIVESGIPEKRINHNGGDVAIGFQLWQNRWELERFNTQPEYIRISDAPRRGFREGFQWHPS